MSLAEVGQADADSAISSVRSVFKTDANWQPESHSIGGELAANQRAAVAVADE
jgi:hypothetical protein